jgi:hypothetical protein
LDIIHAIVVDIEESQAVSFSKLEQVDYMEEDQEMHLIKD